MELMRIHCSVCYYLGICSFVYRDGNRERYRKVRHGYLYKAIMLTIACFLRYITFSDIATNLQAPNEIRTTGNYTSQFETFRSWYVYSVLVGTIHFLFGLCCNLFALNESNCKFLNDYLRKCAVVSVDDHLKTKMFAVLFLLQISLIALLLFLLTCFAIANSDNRDFLIGLSILFFDVNVVACEYLLVLLFYVGSRSLAEIELHLETLLIRLGGGYQDLYRRRTRSPSSIRHFRHYALPYMELKMLRQRHNTCLDQLERLRHRYRWYMLMMTALNLIHLFYSVYHTAFNVYQALFELKRLKPSIVGTVSGGLYHSFKLWLLCTCDDTINDRIKSLDIVLDRLLLSRSSTELIFYKALVTVLSYVVVLVQISNDILTNQEPVVISNVTKSPFTLC